MLSDCISSVLNTTTGLIEIIIVDNGSTDENFNISYSLFRADEKTHWMRTGANLPLGAAKNAGARASKGKYVVFLDNDTVTTAGWLEELINCLENNPNAGAVQSLLVSPKREVQHSGGITNSLGLGFSLHSLGHYLHNTSPVEVFFAAGAGTAIRREVLHKIGLFDTHITFTDDVDLSWRINLSGRNVLICPTSVVVHFGGRTTVSTDPIKLYRQRCFSYELLHVSTKNYSAKYLITNLPKILFLLGLMFSQRLRARNLRPALAYVGGIWSFITTLPKVWAERIFVQKMVRKISDRNLQEKMLLVDWSEMFEFAISLLRGKKPIGPVGRRHP